MTTWTKNANSQDLAWNKHVELTLKDLYIEAQSSNKYTNLIDEDREYLIKKLKKLDNIVDMTEVSAKTPSLFDDKVCREFKPKQKPSQLQQTL